LQFADGIATPPQLSKERVVIADGCVLTGFDNLPYFN
jgi:hypothetical protein